MQNRIRTSGMVGIVAVALWIVIPASAHAAPAVERLVGQQPGLVHRAATGTPGASDHGPVTRAEIIGLGMTGLGLAMAGSMLYLSHRDPVEVRI